MKTLLVIPARYASSRFPGKPLVEIQGATGLSLSLIERSWRQAVTIKNIDKCVVATDDQRIFDHVIGFGGEAIMTSEAARNGTERCAEVAKKWTEFDLIVNFQGDAPLTPPWFVEEILQSLKETEAAVMATPILPLSPEHLAAFRLDRQRGLVGGTTVVVAPDSRAIYFSKEVLPYTPPEETSHPFYHHVGVYAFRRAALLDYAAREETALEKREGLEQLRFIAAGQHVHCVEVATKGQDFWELNNPEDVERIEAILKRAGAS